MKGTALYLLKMALTLGWAFVLLRITFIIAPLIDNNYFIGIAWANYIFMTIVVMVIWTNFNVCPKLLQPDSEVEAFKLYVLDMNAIIKNIADDYGSNVKYIDIYSYPFSPEQVSDVDCFHPDLRGQRILAELTWNAGFFA